MACRQVPGPHQILHRLRQRKQPEQVRDVAAALPQGLRERLLGMAEALHQLLVAARLLHRVQVGALDVLDDGDLQDLGVVEVAHDRGNLVQLRALRGPPPTLAGDDLVAVRVTRALPEDQGLDDPFLADRCGELVQGGVSESPPRLPRAWRDAVDADRRFAGARRSSCGCRLRFQVGHESRNSSLWR